MKLKMPSVKGMQHMEYLGHFSQDKWLAKGHNDVAETGENTAAALKSIREALRGQDAPSPKAASGKVPSAPAPDASEDAKRMEAAARRSQESKERAARQARENDLAEQEKRPAREVE